MMRRIGSGAGIAVLVACLAGCAVAPNAASPATTRTTATPVAATPSPGQDSGQATTVVCSTSMELALDPPPGQTQLKELYGSLVICGSAKHWVSTARRYPHAVGVSHLSVSQAKADLALLCSTNPGDDGPTLCPAG